MLQLILFGFFSVIALISSVIMITRRNPIISALFLVLNFGALAGLYLTLNAQFIAVVQIIVYAGAIMVLFLFVIMLLRPEGEKGFFETNKNVKWLAIVIGIVVFIQLTYIIFIGNPSAAINPNINHSIQVGKVEAIGRELYTKYVLPVQAAGFLLLAAAIGAMVLAKKKFE
jgi:NADH-quinone oxidoreductase subunit J